MLSNGKATANYRMAIVVAGIALFTLPACATPSTLSGEGATQGPTANTELNTTGALEPRTRGVAPIVPLPEPINQAPITTLPAPINPNPAPITTLPAPINPNPAPITTLPAPINPNPAPITTLPAQVGAEALSTWNSMTPLQHYQLMAGMIENSHGIYRIYNGDPNNIMFVNNGFNGADPGHTLPSQVLPHAVLFRVSDQGTITMFRANPNQTGLDSTFNPYPMVQWQPLSSFTIEDLLARYADYAVNASSQISMVIDATHP
jgi:hypothetical protein